MSSIDAEERETAEATALLHEAPTLATPDWLPPDTGWGPLDELTVEHTRLLRARRAVSDEETALRARFTAEDATARAALEEAFERGEPVEPPSVTPTDERHSLLNEVKNRRRAANRVFGRFIQTAVERLAAEAPGLLATLTERQDAASERRREAEAILAEARAEETEALRLREWLLRNAGLHERASFRNVPAMRYVGWDLISTMRPPPPGRLRPTGAPVPVDTYPGPATHAANLNRGRVPSLDEVSGTHNTPSTENDA